MRIRKSRIQFSPPPDLVSSSKSVPPPSLFNVSSTSLFSNHNHQVQNSRSVGNGEQSNESCSSSGSNAETSSGWSVELGSEEKEKNRCSRKNGVGWRCRKQNEEGHSLCYHHIHQSRNWKRLNISSSCRVGKKKQRMMMISSLLNRPFPLLPNPIP